MERALLCLGLLLWSSSLVGCASLRAPVDGPAEATTASQGKEERAVHIDAVEGRGDRLVLRMRLTEEVASGTRLEVLRREGDVPAEVVRTIELDEKLLAALGTSDGVQFVDRKLEADVRYRYGLRLVSQEEEVIASSAAVDVVWKSPPPRPERVTAVAPTSVAVEVVWEHGEEFGAVIFRRDLLRPGSRPERLAELDVDMRATFVDRDVRAGGVYAYRVALARRRGDVVQYGPASEEVYVTIATETPEVHSRRTRGSAP